MLTVSDTVKVPPDVYWWLGFHSVDVLPSPKFQCHEVGELVLKSVNDIVTGACPPVLLALKSATGMWLRDVPPP